MPQCIKKRKEAENKAGEGQRDNEACVNVRILTSVYSSKNVSPLHCGINNHTRIHMTRIAVICVIFMFTLISGSSSLITSISGSGSFFKNKSGKEWKG